MKINFIHCRKCNEIIVKDLEVSGKDARLSFSVRCNQCKQMIPVVVEIPSAIQIKIDFEPPITIVAGERMIPQPTRDGGIRKLS